MDQPVGQKIKARTFKVKKNNTNSIASEFFPPFVASAPEPKKRIFKVASSTATSREVPVPVAAPLGASPAVPALQGNGEKVEGEELPKEENVEPNKPVLKMEKDKKDCETLYHPCTGSPITDENPLKIIQKKILEQGVDYALLNSGSKINTLTKAGTADKFYKDASSNRDKTLAIDEEDSPFKALFLISTTSEFFNLEFPLSSP
jgi:hypothetical protein